jgi:hypothetical protein
MLTQQEHEGKMLKWAARTYVVAALGLSLLYYIMFPFIWEAVVRRRLKLFPEIEAVSF